MKRGRRLAIAAGLASLLMAPPAARATFPGENGPITYSTTGDGPGDVYIVDLDGIAEEPFNVTETSAPEDPYPNEQQPAFGPFADEIAFWDFDGENTEIYKSPASGGPQVQLTTMSEDYQAGNPVYSPDGQNVFYDASFPHTPGDPFSGRRELFVVDTEPPSLEGQLTDTRYSDEEEPDVDDDGEFVAFVRNSCVVNDDPPPNFNCSGREIWKASFNGTGLSAETQLTNLPATQTDYFQASAPSWSPDGLKIAYTVDNINGQTEIWIMDADGSNKTQITNTSSVNEYQAVWSPDGTKLLYVANHPGSGNYELFVQDAMPNAPVTPVTNLPDPQRPQFPSWAPAQLVDIQTTITKKPPEKIEKRKAVFKYEATPSSGTTFECKLNREPFELCGAGKQKYFGLENGDYKFQVRGSDGSRFDPTPAKAKFKVRVPRGQGR